MGQKKLDSLGVSAFCESMARMVQAGIQTDEAVALLGQGGGKGGLLEQGLLIMKAETEQGKSLSGAMEAAGCFPEYAVRMILAGEKAGRLEEILFGLADYYADQKVITEKLKNAVMYPAAMLVLVILVLAAMLALVLPAFTDVYNSLTGSLTASAYSYVRWAYGLCWFTLAVMLLLAAVFFLGIVLWNGKGRHRVERALGRVPLCGSVLSGMGMFRFMSALSAYLASGEMQDIAVEESIRMASYQPLEEKLQSCAKRMEEGHSFAQSAYEEALFEPVYGRMLLAGERSGSLESVLGRLKDLLEESCFGKVDRLVGIVDPLLSGVLMLSVGLSLLSVMLPLIGMMNAIG